MLNTSREERKIMNINKSEDLRERKEKIQLGGGRPESRNNMRKEINRPGEAGASV